MDEIIHDVLIVHLGWQVDGVRDSKLPLSLSGLRSHDFDHDDLIIVAQE